MDLCLQTQHSQARAIHFHYFQRKLKEYNMFPLVIDMFLSYFQRKLKEYDMFPLVIDMLLSYFQRKPQNL